MGEDEENTPVPHGPDPTLLAMVSGLAYGALAALGVVVGLVGSFTHALTLGAVPVALVALLAVNLGGPWLAGRAMGGKLGGAVPAAAWTVVVVLMSTKRAEGDLVIAGTGYGYGFIIGGMLAAGVAIMLVPSSSWPAPPPQAARP